MFFQERRLSSFAIGDEVYEHLVFDGRRHATLLSVPDLRDRAFVVSSTAKTFSMTGWKIGYVVASPELSGPHVEALAEIAKLARSKSFCKALVNAESAKEVVELLQGN